MTATARCDRPFAIVGLISRLCASLALLSIAACEADGEPTSERDAGRTPEANSAMDGGGHAPLDARVEAALDAHSQRAETDAANVLPRDAAAELLSHRLDELAASRRAWDALASATPGPYWYEEENCVLNARGVGGSSVVQIDADGGHVVERRSFSRSECQAAVNRFGDLLGAASGQAGPAFAELYTLCAKQLSDRPDTTLSFDTRGLVKDCWVGDAPRCRDACGSGFSLRQWGFGSAPRAADAGVASDGGH